MIRTLVIFLAAVVGSFAGMRFYMAGYPEAPRSLAERNDAIAILYCGLGAGSLAAFASLLGGKAAPSSRKRTIRELKAIAANPDLPSETAVRYEVLAKELEDLKDV